MIRGECVRFDDGFINSIFNLPYVEDGHEVFVNSMTTEKGNKILVDLCEINTTWTISTKESRLVKRLALKPQSRGWNHFLKATLRPTSHNEIVLEDVAINEILVSLSTGIIPTLPSFSFDLFAGDFSHLASLKAHSSTPSNATKLVSTTVDESTKTVTPP
ncbi:hypothetical protein V6N11_010375 [Hibiscus sabdariffa]|uniref:Uncharacterized protein n=1 Tax=Hibiscus sabdariffa TaxID=183260 RepID=A0ABR2S556_9ROSI